MVEGNRWLDILLGTFVSPFLGRGLLSFLHSLSGRQAFGQLHISQRLQSHPCTLVLTKGYVAVKQGYWTVVGGHFMMWESLNVIMDHIQVSP